ncbi:MAG: hypothetical protein EZS28_013461 [Streblomastix strix]|uniref:Uncharacterized protein n=1 Tax=Streblomastix strix TaxID=222440 RepID=A0A5J4W9H4_9EUKA|nr:MAG: hypothetical protein EZS28_013461 [Streblomastix strix]
MHPKLIGKKRRCHIWTWKSNSSGDVTITGALLAVIVEKQQGFCSDSSSKTDRYNTSNSRRSESITSRILYFRQIKCESKLVIKICYFRRSSDQSECNLGSIILTTSPNIDCYVCKQNQQEFQTVRDTYNRQFGNDLGQSISPMNGRNLMYASSNSNDISNPQQGKIRGSTYCDSGPELAISTQEIQPCGVSSEICEHVKMQRRLEAREMDAKSVKTPPMRRDTNSAALGGKGEQLLVRILTRRQFSFEAMDKVIEGFHSIWRRHRQKIGEFEENLVKSGKSWKIIRTAKDPIVVISNFLAQPDLSRSTDFNTNACKIAIGMLFRIQGFQEKKLMDSCQSK